MIRVLKEKIKYFEFFFLLKNPVNQTKNGKDIKLLFHSQRPCLSKRI